MSSSLFGALVSWYSYDDSNINGLRRANEGFIRAVVRYSKFDQLHLFFLPEQISRFEEDHCDWMQKYGADKKISLISINELPNYLAQHTYTVFHQGDHHLASLAELRNQFSDQLFPLTGRAHSLSDDPTLSRTRDLILAPVKSCDGILCSSTSQQKVMAKLLSAASASLSDSVGVAIPYSGQVSLLPLGMSVTGGQDSFGGPVSSEMKTELKAGLGLDQNKSVILCLGRITASDKADLQPLLITLNNLVEQEKNHEFQLVIAGAGDPGSEAVRMLTSMAYELNLEDSIRFELSIDEPRKQMLLSASDIFVSISDNIQESFGLSILEAMKARLAVIASDWNGHRDLIEHDRSGFLIETQTIACESFSRPLSLMNKPAANFFEAQSTAVNVEQLTDALDRLLGDKELRAELGSAARSRAEEQFDWPVIMAQYHKLVETLGQNTDGQYQKHRNFGTPYLDAFGHYPSRHLEAESWLKITDRGLRVYLQSEQGSIYKQLRFLLDRNVVRAILYKAVSGATVAELQALVEDKNTSGVVLGWMLKHHLLKTIDHKAEKKAPYQCLLPDRSDDNGVVYPEAARSNMLKPVVNHFVHCLKTSVNSSVACQQSLVRIFVEHFDSRLFQAICWYREEHQLQDYHQILNQLEKEGGLSVLAERYPFWLRNGRRQFIKELKQYRRLIARFDDHLSEINTLFFTVDQKAMCILEVEPLFSEQSGRVYKLGLDNGEQLVYKERNLKVDAVLTGRGGLMDSLSEWLDEYPCPASHKILPLQDDLGDFGLTEYVVTGSSAPSYGDYQKALGALLGFCLMTGQSDVHQLNVLVSNGVPYLIDAEAPLQGPVVMRLVDEIHNPQGAFVRGLRETGLGHTGLLDIWELFHTYRMNFCSHELENGCLQESPAQLFQPVLSNFIEDGHRHPFDDQQPSLSEKYSEQIVEGFEKAIRAIVDHSDIWCKSLDRLNREEISYKPVLDCVAIRKQQRYTFVEKVFQQLSLQETNDYFRRISRRITGTAEVSQRWLETQWQEPTSELADGFYVSLMDQSDAYFSRIPLSHSCSRVTATEKAQVVAGNFFSINSCEVLMGEVGKLASSEQLLERFIKNYRMTLDDWLKHHCQPGRDLDSTMKEYLIEAAGIKSIRSET